jgi:hypothetical protein
MFNRPLLDRKLRIAPRHLQLAIRNDDELSALIGKAHLPEGGVRPHIEPQLLKHSGGKIPYSSVKIKTVSTPKNVQAKMVETRGMGRGQARGHEKRNQKENKPRGLTPVVEIPMRKVVKKKLESHPGEVSL